MFTQFLELARRSKNEEDGAVRLPLATLVMSLLVLFFTLVIGIIVSLVPDKRLPY